MQEEQGLAFGPFRLDLRDERLWRGHEAIPLSPKTFAVLCCLMRQAGQLVTKDALLRAVWPETVVSESVVTAVMRTLRRVLGDQARMPRFIETVHGRGYRFIASVWAPAAAAGSASGGAPRHALPLFRRPPHFVGRDTALAQLAQWWVTACQGRRQVGMIVGAPGIGKTALVDTFVAQLAATEAIWIGHGQCIDHYGAGEPYLPVLEAVGRLCQAPAGASLVALLHHHAPSWLVQMPALLPPLDREALQRTAGGATPTRMLRELTEALDQLTVERPLLLVLEDLHWSDVSTLTWLAYVARRRDPARLLILGTYRPGDAMVRAHPVRTVMTELMQHQQGAELVLDSLSAADVALYLCQRVRVPSLPDALVQVLHQRTRGHPLFLVMLVDELLRQRLLGEDATSWDLARVVETVRGMVPASLRQTIEQQLHQVSPEDHGLLEAASIAGGTFSAAAVAAGLDQPTEDIETRLARLADQGQFIQSCRPVAWPDGTEAAGYAFLHDLYREILYDRIPPSRQQRWHLQIGARKEQGYGVQAREMAAELAEHFVRGRDPYRAVQYLCDAGENALQRRAYQEAVTHLTKSSELLQTLPETPARQQRELTVLTTLGSALMAIKGFAAPEVAHTYSRAHALCGQSAETPPLFAVLHGLWLFSLVRAQLTQARQLAAQLLTLAQRLQDAAARVAAHNALGGTLYYLGELPLARAHVEQALGLYTPQQRRSSACLHWREDDEIVGRCHATHILWLLGYPDHAWQQSQEALARAQGLDHPMSLTYACIHAARLHQFRREAHGAQTHADAVIALATAHGFPHYVALGTVLRGWALTAQAQGAEGLAQIEQGLALYRATGARVYQPYVLALLAEVCGRSGRVRDGLSYVAEALTQVHTTRDDWWAAELYRLQGELQLQQTLAVTAPAEASWCQALAVARRQQAKSLELRAALSLARLWQRQGKRAAAYELLAPIYGWFTEGFVTADLQEARILLEAP
jgi:predicted ATPase/DNA-binding winged helix-turn-helix (wHTH) protein